MFATQGPADPQSFTALWINVAFVLNVLVSAATLLSVNRSKKREVSFTFTPASKEEFDKHVEKTELHLASIHRELGERIAELPEMERRIGTQGEARIEKVHNRINDVLAGVNRLAGKLDILENKLTNRPRQ